jgi:hypothetical protein
VAGAAATGLALALLAGAPASAAGDGHRCTATVDSLPSFSNSLGVMHTSRVSCDGPVSVIINDTTIDLRPPGQLYPGFTVGFVRDQPPARNTSASTSTASTGPGCLGGFYHAEISLTVTFRSGSPETITLDRITEEVPITCNPIIPSLPTPPPPPPMPLPPMENTRPNPNDTCPKSRPNCNLP